MLAANPGLGDSAITKKLADYTVQMGGPLKKDKAFFFASIQRYSATTDPTGPVANVAGHQPALQHEVHAAADVERHASILGTQYDSYNVTGRVGYWPASQATDQQTVTEDAPEWVWNAQWRKVFGTNTFLEAKFTGYSGYYYLDPIDPSPFTYDGETDEYTGGGGGLYYADRSRNQVQVSLTRYADEVRQALAQVRRRDRAKPRAEPVSALRSRGFLHLRLRRRAVLPRQLRLRCPGRQQADLCVCAGSVERWPTDAEHRVAPRSSSRLQPGS